MKLQKATSFAIYAVLELAADPEHQLSVVEIAEKYSISAHHLAKVLRDLGRAGIVDSVRGVGGGYRFASNAKRLTLMDVIRIFEPIGFEGAGDNDADLKTDAGRCLRLVLDEIDEIAIATFGSITISTMLKLINRRVSIAPGSMKRSRKASGGR